MNLEDMILVSIDDHVMEPLDMFEGHVPQQWAEQAPKVERSPEGVDRRAFESVETSTLFGVCAVVTWPKEEWGFNRAEAVEQQAAQV